MEEQVSGQPVDPEQVAAQLRECYDPELFISIVELGLVYRVEIKGGVVEIEMSLTSPACPAGPHLIEDIRKKVGALPGVKEVVVNITFEPPWTPEKMSEGAKAELGIL